jgi:hypothetical protein
MANLTIEGRSVTVDDSFLALSHDEQNATVDEISKSLGPAAPSPTPAPAQQALAPAQQALAPAPQQASAAQPSFLGSAVSTLGHAASDIPVIGPAAQWLTDNALAQTVGRMSGQDPGDWLKHAQAARDANDQANPIAAEAGGVAGNVAAAMATGGASPVAAEALGMSGKLLPSIEAGAPQLGRAVSSGLSTFGLTAADKMVRGEAPAQAAQEAVGPGMLGAGLPVAADGIGKAVGAGVDAINGARQAAVTNKAIAGAPDAAGLRDAGSALFGSSVDTAEPPAISGGAYNRLLDGLRASLGKYRPNELNDPQVVGVLQNLAKAAADANTPGKFVDLKELHLQRQLANDVAGMPGRQGAMGRIVVDQIDNFIQTLKPTDILGGADPSQATSDLMNGISTWNRANKVGVIQTAIQKADGYKTGTESGLKSTFSNLMKSDDFNRFNPEEQQAIRAVAKGSPLQNTASTFGKLGVDLNSSNHNFGGGAMGSAIVGAPLIPLLGPVLGPAVGIASSSAAGAVGRTVAKNMATKSANRAAQIVATDNIPKVSPWSLPPAVQQAGPIAQQVGQGAIMAKGAPDRQKLKSPVAKAIYDAGSR